MTRKIADENAAVITGITDIYKNILTNICAIIFHCITVFPPVFRSNKCSLYEH